jgi:uncharacterized damage-inducible protein DinB
MDSLQHLQTLAHMFMFNHGTHCRGQITATWTAMGPPAPERDMVYMLQSENKPEP